MIRLYRHSKSISDYHKWSFLPKGNKHHLNTRRYYFSTVAHQSVIKRWGTLGHTSSLDFFCVRVCVCVIGWSSSSYGLQMALLWCNTTGRLRKLLLHDSANYVQYQHSQRLHMPDTLLYVRIVVTDNIKKPPKPAYLYFPPQSTQCQRVCKQKMVMTMWPGCFTSKADRVNLHSQSCTLSALNTMSIGTELLYQIKVWSTVARTVLYCSDDVCVGQSSECSVILSG